MQYLKKWLEEIWNAIIRGIVGCTIIYGISYCFNRVEFPELVGVNIVSFFTIAFLGVPGFLLLYGISFLLLFS